MDNEYSLIKEDEYLTIITELSSKEFCDKCILNFHSKYHPYPFGVYLNELDNVKRLLLKGGLSEEQILFIVKNNATELVCNW